MGCYFLEQISFGDIPNSRNLLFLQIFPQRAVKPSAGNISARSAPKLPGTLVNLIWLCTRRSPVPSPEPVEPDLAPCTKAPQTFSGTFSGTLLNLTWLCTKASLLRNLLRNPESSAEPCWTWPGSAPKPPRPSLEPMEPCWSWPGSAPKPPKSSPQASPERCWTWPGSTPKPPRPSPEPSPEHDLALHQSLPDLHRYIFSGTLSGTLLNLTWLCTKASQTFTFSGTLLNLTWSRTSKSILRPYCWAISSSKHSSIVVYHKSNERFIIDFLLIVRAKWAMKHTIFSFHGKAVPRYVILENHLL